jgi:hypothetical protein
MTITNKNITVPKTKYVSGIETGSRPFNSADSGIILAKVDYTNTSGADVVAGHLWYSITVQLKKKVPTTEIRNNYINYHMANPLSTLVQPADFLAYGYNNANLLGIEGNLPIVRTSDGKLRVVERIYVLA